MEYLFVKIIMIERLFLKNNNKLGNDLKFYPVGGFTMNVCLIKWVMAILMNISPIILWRQSFVSLDNFDPKV